jgi:hypothetical protein
MSNNKVLIPFPARPPSEVDNIIYAFYMLGQIKTPTNLSSIDCKFIAKSIGEDFYYGNTIYAPDGATDYHDYS